MTSLSSLSCVLKNVQNIFVNEMTSLTRLVVGFEYYMSARKTVNKWLYEEWKVCTHILQWHNPGTQQTQITVRHLSHFAQPVKWLWQQKSIYYYYMCIVDYVMIRIPKRLSDNIHKTELFLLRSVHTIQFLHPLILNSIFFGKHAV